MIRLIKLAAGVAGKPVQEIQFQGPGVNIAAVGPGGESYVSAPITTIHQLAREFLGVESVNSTKKKSTGHRHKHQAANLNLIDASSGGRAQALQVVAGFANLNNNIPIFYPRKTTANGGGFQSPPRAYELRTAGLKKFAAYRTIDSVRDTCSSPPTASPPTSSPINPTAPGS